jgi:hypothetical protein
VFVAYTAVGMCLAAGVMLRSGPAVLLAVEILLVLLWCTNVGGLRVRVPISHSPRRAVVALGGLGLASLGLVLVGAASTRPSSAAPPREDPLPVATTGPTAALAARAAAAEHLESAREYRAAGELGLALEAARQAVALAPDDAEARALLAAVVPPAIPPWVQTGVDQRTLLAESDPSTLRAPAASIAGLTAADVTARLEPHGFRCRAAERSDAGGYWTCRASASDGLTHYEVEVVGESATQIRAVSATIFQPRSVPSEQRAVEFLVVVGTLAYQGAEPARARRWIEDHVATGGVLTVGAADLSLLGGPRARSLKLLPAALP